MALGSFSAGEIKLIEDVQIVPNHFISSLSTLRNLLINLIAEMSLRRREAIE